ncbi:MAG TPA: zf-HC2 domain-containing protein [Streptosporangiaceae bacterium]|nr:zf-HC2 domain-containing protein [Streptosporangiaceae bacterium]
MTQTWDCTEARLSLGVYVLGAIDPGERGLVDAHLLTCRDCRDELAGLAGLPALLARVNPDEISRIRADDTVRPASDDPPEELLGTVLGLAEARRRRNRWRYLSAAAAVAAIAGGLFAGLNSATSTTVTKTVVAGFNGAAPWDTADGTNGATGVTATVAYAHQLWGDSFQVLVDDIPVGTTCQMWVTHPDGTRTEVAAWTTSRDEGTVWYGGSMPSTAGSISTFQITAGNRVLLTVTPD